MFEIVWEQIILCSNDIALFALKSEFFSTVVVVMVAYNHLKTEKVAVITVVALCYGSTSEL